MRCLSCQQENPPRARFCNACGARLEPGCPACGHANPPRSRFCNECGRALAAGEPEAAGSGVRVPRPRIPGHLAEKILTSRAAFEGERKQVTVLFADLKGSMELLADRDPEEARTLLDPVLERMMEAVHRYDGTVNQVLGDGIMALFGAPVAHEDHAVRACYAALAMQDAVRRYTDEVRRTHGVEVQIRVGLNSGEVVVRAIGNDLHMDYSAVGQTTHLAARMEQLATPGRIRLTAATLRLAEGFVRVRSLGPVPVKGVAEPVEVFELADAAPARTRFHAMAARGLTRFVGRRRELDRLDHALEQARAGHGQILAVVGEAGVGKSRLFWEFVHTDRTRGWLVLESSSVSYGKATAYLPLVDLLKAYFRIDPQDDERRIREKVTGKLLILDESLRAFLPAVLGLLEVRSEDGSWRDLGVNRRRQETVDAVKRILLRESRVQPLCLVFEDLHWIDPDTRAALDALVESLAGARILLLVNYRPEYQHGWGGKTYYAQLPLDPLPVESAEELLQALLGDDPALEPVRRLLIQQTEGNPFFLEESVRTLVETHVLTGERGRYRLRKTLDAVQVPATVQAVLAARIDRLPAEDKALLQTAAAVGKDVPFELLRAIADLPEDRLHLGLGRLQGGEFLYESALFPELEYTFRHGLTHEVAYQSLLHDRRRSLHARVVEVFEQLYPDRIGDQAKWLAHHAFRGELWPKALGYLGRITSTADPAGLDAIVGGPESPGYLWWTGDYDRAMRAAERDLAVATSFRNFGLMIVSTHRLGQICHALGDYPRAIELLRQNVEALGAELLHDRLGMAGLPAVLSRAWLAWSLAERGEFGEATTMGEDGVCIAEGAEHPYSLVVACFGLGTVSLLGGALDRAIPVLERGLAVARAAGLSLLVPFVASSLGAAYAASGRTADGVALLEQAVRDADAAKLMAHQSLRIVRLAEARLLAGEPAQALRLGEQALELSRQLRERGNEGWVLRLLGEIRSRDGSAPAQAEQDYRQAMSVAERLGMRPLLASCQLGLARHDG